jgi:hypothetical protein
MDSVSYKHHVSPFAALVRFIYHTHSRSYKLQDACIVNIQLDYFSGFWDAWFDVEYLTYRSSHVDVTLK